LCLNTHQCVGLTGQEPAGTSARNPRERQGAKSRYRQGRSCTYSGTAMAYRRRLKNKKMPEGWELIEEVIEDFEAQMKEAVNEEHEGRRKNELTWKINRIHWEKNRFIYDLMHVRKVMSKELVRP
jgi:hypothetical protein